MDVGNYNYNNIDLLVGRNVELLFLPLYGKENVRVDKNCVLAVNSKLGWTIAGPLKTAATTACFSCNVTIVNTCTIVSSNDEEVSIAVELRRLKFWKDGRITVQMLWKGKFAYVPLSKAAARKRLQLLHKKLAKATPAVRAEYAKTITDDVNNVMPCATLVNNICLLKLYAQVPKSK